MISIKKLAFLSFLLLPLSSCTWDYFVPDVITGPVSLQTDIIPIFDQYCNMSGCHDGVAFAPDLTPANAYNDMFATNQIDTVNPELSKLYVRMTTTTPLPMPTSGLLDANKTNLVLEWITQGAKNN